MQSAELTMLANSCDKPLASFTAFSSVDLFTVTYKKSIEKLKHSSICVLFLLAINAETSPASNKGDLMHHRYKSENQKQHFKRVCSDT
jgi:hypothetical protein